VPTGGSRWAVNVQSRLVSVQGDGFEEKIITRRPGHFNHEVVPGIVYGIARHSSWNPFLVHIVVSVPFMATGDAALMSPDKAFGGDELVYVELQGLRSRDVFRVKVHVVNEIVKVRDQGMAGVINSLG